MRQVILATAVGLLCGAGCDAPKNDEPIQKATKPTELKQSSDTKMSKEELEEARRKAGFKSFDEQAAENMAEMEKGEREYIKRRLDKYRPMLAEVRGFVDTIEKEAEKWPKAKNSQAAFDAFAEKYRENMKAFLESYNELTEQGTKGGNAQAKIGAAMRSLSDLNNDLRPDIASEPSFKKSLEDIRAALDEVDKELDAIEKDESLDASGAEADAEGDAKADDAKAGDAKAGDAKAG